MIHGRHMSSAMSIAVLWLAMGLSAPAQQTAPKLPDEFAAMVVSKEPGAATKLSIQVIHWLADDERAKVLGVLKAEGAGLEKALSELPTVGYIWTGGSIGYSVKYAARTTEADGRETIVLATADPFGRFESSVKADAAAGKPRQFSVLELHMSRKDKGDGRISVTGPVSINQEKNTLTIEDYDRTPISLTAVAPVPKPYWTTAK